MNEQVTTVDSVFNTPTTDTIPNEVWEEREVPTGTVEASFPNTFPTGDFRHQRIEELKQADPNRGFLDNFVDAWKANAYGVGRVNHPAGTRVDPDFSLTDPEVKKELMTLPEDVRKSVMDYNPGNRTEFDAVIARTQDELQWQENIYNDSGLLGSIGYNLLGGILQPDLVLGGPWAAASKAAKSATTSVKISNAIRSRGLEKPFNIVGTGVEVGVFGTGLEAMRQQSSGVSFEDDLYNVGIFSMVLGSGVKATSMFLGGANTKKLAAAMEQDIQETKAVVNNLKPKSAGPMAMSNTKWTEVKITPEDVRMLPTTGVAGKLNKMSVRGRLYNNTSPRLRRLISWMMPSKLPLKNPDGSFHVQSTRSAEDILNTEYKGLFNDFRSVIRESYSEYKQANGGKGLSEYDFGRELFNQRIESGKALREQEAEIKYFENKLAKTQKQIEKLEEQISNLKPGSKSQKPKKLADLKQQELKFTTTLNDIKARDVEVTPIKDIHLAKANKALDDYYGNMYGRSQKWLNDIEDVDVSKSRGYTTRLWNKEAIARNPDATNHETIKQAIINSPTGKMFARVNAEAYDEWVKFADSAADNFIKNVYQIETLNDLMDFMPAPSMFKSRHLMERKLDVDENMLGDLIQRNMDDVAEMYHRNLSGKLALKEALGVTSKKELGEEINAITKELRDLGYSVKEIKAITDDLDVAFDSLMGVRSISNDPGSTGNTIKRYVTKWNNITLGMGFGYTSIMEIGPVLALTGARGLKYLFPAIGNTIRKYRGKESDVAIYNQLKAMGIGMDVYNSRVASRFTDDGINFSDSKIEHLFDRNQARVMHGSGLIAITDSFKDMAGMAYIHNLHELGRKLNSGEKTFDSIGYTERSRMARHGLTEQNIRAIGSQPVKYDANGRLEDLGWDDWESGLKDKLATAVDRAVKGNVLEPSELDLPASLTNPNGLFVPLMLQYMRFPVAATENYLLRALSERDKGAVVGSLISTFVLGTLELGKDEIGQAMGLQPTYDMNTEEGIQKLGWKLFNYNPYSGIIPTGATVGLASLGIAQPGTDYVPKDVVSVGAGPTYGRATGVINLLQSQVSDPGHVGKTEMYNLKMNTPYLGSVPIIKDIWNNYIKQNY